MRIKTGPECPVFPFVEALLRVCLPYLGCPGLGFFTAFLFTIARECWNV
jgi:hypothetical protein